MIAPEVLLIVARFTMSCAVRIQPPTPWTGQVMQLGPVILSERAASTRTAPSRAVATEMAVAARTSVGMSRAVARATTATPKSELISTIKRFQRTSPELKQAWWEFCNSHPGKTHDPARYEADVLKAFLAMHGIQVTDSFIKEELVNTIKALQRSSKELKLAWWAFCDRWEGQERDPALYEVDVLQTFLAELGIQDVQGTKDQKDMLVAKIRGFQKAGEKGRQAWSAYCAAQVGQKRDPALYEVGFLEAFVSAIGI